MSVLDFVFVILFRSHDTHICHDMKPEKQEIAVPVCLSGMHYILVPNVGNSSFSH